MVFHMLRWEMGDEGFVKFLRGMLSQYTDKSIRSANVQTVAEAQTKLELTAFFAQWLDGTGAPSFGNKYTVVPSLQGITRDFGRSQLLRRIWTCSGCR